MENHDFTELMPGLPEELGLECLTRLSYSSHRLSSRVCRRWSRLFLSKDFYYHRKKYGYTHKLACMVQAFSNNSSNGAKSGGEVSLSYGITVFDSATQTWDRIDSIPVYPYGLPLFCQLASCEGKIVVMGGWDPDSYNPITDVWIFDFTTQEWTRGKEMPSKRSFFAIGAFKGRVYVVGGHDENKNALKTGWVYDMDSNEWTELPEMSQERDECEGVVIGDEFWVISGYTTENQGEFEGGADVYDSKLGQFRRVEGIWQPGQCPRACVGGVGKDGSLVNWAQVDQEVRVAVCGVVLGTIDLVAGSGYQGGPPGFYMLENTTSSGKLVKINNVTEEFGGFVQSGCCVEI